MEGNSEELPPLGTGQQLLTDNEQVLPPSGNSEELPPLGTGQQLLTDNEQGLPPSGNSEELPPLGTGQQLLTDNEQVLPPSGDPAMPIGSNQSLPTNNVPVLPTNNRPGFPNDSGTDSSNSQNVRAASNSSVLDSVETLRNLPPGAVVVHYNPQVTVNQIALTSVQQTAVQQTSVQNTQNISLQKVENIDQSGGLNISGGNIKDSKIYAPGASRENENRGSAANEECSERSETEPKGFFDPRQRNTTQQTDNNSDTSGEDEPTSGEEWRLYSWTE